MREGSEHGWDQTEGKIKVLCTIGMITDLVKEIGGEHLSVLTMVRGELDPHSYQLVKGDDEKLAAAAIIFYNGLGLEHGPSLREYLSSSGKAVNLGDAIKEIDPSSIIFLDNTPDPHVWMDISLWSKAVPVIVDALSRLDPAHSMQYQENGAALIGKMEEEHLSLQKILAHVPEKNRYLITSHDAFNYFARAYLATEQERVDGGWQPRFAAPEGLAPESQLSTTDIRLILDHMKLYNIRVIFPESNVSQASIRKLLDAGNEEKMQLMIAKEPLYGDAMGPSGSSGNTYLNMIRHNAETLARYLKESGVKDVPKR